MTKQKMDDYNASEIEILEGLEPVRHRPGMYIGGTDNNALHHLATEIIDNSMDEVVAKHANKIEVNLLGDNSINISEEDQLKVSFFVYQNNDSVKVTYYGIRPDLFKDDAEVVVSGSYTNNLISATELQTKCASRYEGDLKNIEKI